MSVPNEDKPKVLVALSGGVDSLATAILLKERGYQVSAGFMKLWPGSDETKAKELADRISIPFHLFDFEEEFKREIIDSFIEAYHRGETPNPCVDCNQKIKFGLFLKEAKRLGFDLVATGHYARIIDGNIYRGRDEAKDQSYFLWRLTSDQIKRLIFPLGDYQKKEIVDNFGINTKDSMEICFIKDLKEFLLKHLGKKEGKIVNDKGETVGSHPGLWFYTVGQRKGIGLSGGPYFITGKDLSNNILLVGKEPPKVKSIRLKDLNFIPQDLTLPLRAEIQLRYNGKMIPALIESDGKVTFDKLQEMTAFGQSGVIYNQERLIGGGIVTEPL